MKKSNQAGFFDDAPPVNVIEAVKYPLDKQIKSELWYGLALDRFDVVGRIHNRDDVVFLMRARKDSPTPWCTQHAGCGRYFHDRDSMELYALYRYGGKPLKGKKYLALEEARRQHLKDGTPLRDLL